MIRNKADIFNSVCLTPKNISQLVPNSGLLKLPQCVQLWKESQKYGRVNSMKTVNMDLVDICISNLPAHPSYDDWVTNYPQIWWCKATICYAHNFEGHEFKHGTEGTVLLCSMISGILWKLIYSHGWQFRLAVGWRPQSLFSWDSLCDLSAWAGLGFLEAWWLGSKSECAERERELRERD